MSRKIGGIALAVVLAIVGTVALVAYVNKAKDDAVADVQPVSILVFTEAIPQGASMAQIEEAVELTDVPKDLVSDNALVSLASVDPTLVAGVAFEKGEQLRSTRLVDPESLIRVDVPEGLQEITLALDPERAVGGVLQPGQLVGVIISFDPFDINTSGVPEETGAEPTETTVEAPTKTPNTTHLTLQQVLVTSVQISANDSERRIEVATDDSVDSATRDEAVNEAPGDRLLVTLAVSSSQAEQLVFAAEFGYIWLTRQNDDTDSEPTRIITIDQVYVTVANE